MNFNSLYFLVFLGAVLALHRIVPHRFRWIVLLVASYWFYMSWDALLSLLILGTTLVSYGAALLLSRTRSRAKKNACLVIALIVCLGLLLFFKYGSFLLENLLRLLQLLQLPVDAVSFSVVLPVGISFYTFQTLSYVIDVYRGTLPAEKHFGYYALFVSFFPQLVAGPIERPGNLLPQLKTERTATADDMREGLQLLLRGYLRKTVIADFAGIFVDKVYASPASASAPAILIATVLFTVQIYCDFAGYSEIAAGCARMMGIRLMCNFDRPYLAVGIRDFWRRWHISLTSWFTDYLYIPLGGNRKGKARRCLNTMIVFLVSGLWHGAAWTFVIWGGIHGVLVVTEVLLAPLGKKLYGKCGASGQAVLRMLSRIGTFAAVCFAWIFFRAASLSDAGVLIGNLFTAWHSFGLELSALDIVQLVLCAALLCSLPYLLPLRENTAVACRLPLAAKSKSPALLPVFATLAIAAVWIWMLRNNVSNGFIYFQF